MTLQGDLATLELGDVLQSLAGRRQSGSFTVEEPGGERTVLYLAEGELSLLARRDRPTLMDVLLLAGELSEVELERVRKKRRRSRRSLGETAVDLGLLDADGLAAFARQRLVAEACEVLAIEHGRFHFEDGGVPRGVFDPEERALALAVPIGPLLLESARRTDHWREIRHILPHDGAYLQRLSGVKSDDPDLAKEIAERLDGTSTVAEIVAAFPHLRFEAFQTLATWVRAGRAARLDADALVALARAEASVDPTRAKECVERGLREFPNHLELLALRVAVAEELGELEDAVEALKLRVHAELGQGLTEEARADLAHARELAPNDATLVERAFELALEAGDEERALEDGRRWVELLREPGLFRRAAEVLDRLVALAPEDVELRVDLARARATCGDVQEARALLEVAFRSAIERGEFALAQRYVDALLELDPTNGPARRAAEDLANGELERRRERRRRRTRLAVGSVVLTALGSFTTFEWAARTAFRDAAQAISEAGWIERAEYRAAADRYREVRATYPWTITALVDVPEAVRELERKARRRGPAPEDDRRGSAGEDE